ncbi:MAG: hypothetical protein KAY37_04045, partial [Phycisphaerae bacterium]|nr:hypothetical protein [Phycisphaerae bacterium]
MLLAATFFLISPVPGKTYPGQIPWRDISVLRPLTELMSLNGLVATERGVEIKDFAFHLAAALGLALLGVSQFAKPALRGHSRAAKTASYAQILLAGWVLLSLLSSLWSGAPNYSGGQAALYALCIGWAVALSQTLARRDLPRLLYGVLIITALGAALCVWYYYERNPHHRPGFPLGNATVLAPAILPGVLIAGAVLCGSVWMLLCGTVWSFLRTGRVTWSRPAIGAGGAGLRARQYDLMAAAEG